MSEGVSCSGATFAYIDLRVRLSVDAGIAIVDMNIPIAIRSGMRSGFLDPSITIRPGARPVGKPGGVPAR